MNRLIQLAVIMACASFAAYDSATAYAEAKSGQITVRDNRGAVVGYLESFTDGDVYDARHKKIGHVDSNGTYDANGHRLLDQPLPGWLLAKQNDQ